MQSRIVLITVCEKTLISSDGSTTVVVYNFDLPKFRNILPYANSLVLFTLVDGAPSADDLELNVQFRSGHDRDHELATPVSLATALITANGSVRHASVSAGPSFQLVSRVQVTAKNRSGVSGVRTATLSAVIAVELLA